MNGPSPPQLLTVDDVAGTLRVHPRTVRRWIAEGVLPAIKLSPGSIRIKPADLLEFQESSKAG